MHSLEYLRDHTGEYLAARRRGESPPHANNTVVGWRQLQLISARSCTLTLWLLRSDAYSTYDAGLARNRKRLAPAQRPAERHVGDYCHPGPGQSSAGCREQSRMCFQLS